MISHQLSFERLADRAGFVGDCQIAARCNAPMPATPKCRWFQFRLWTLLVAVVLIGAACYVAQQWRIVAARKSWLAQYPQFDVDGPFASVLHPTATSDLPLIRLLLGDISLDSIFVTNPAQEASAKELFPEAEIGRGL